jgi:hypothetical protein
MVTNFWPLASGHWLLARSEKPAAKTPALYTYRYYDIATNKKNLIPKHEANNLLLTIL